MLLFVVESYGFASITLDSHSGVGVFVAHNQAGYRGGFEHVDLRANVRKIVAFSFSVKGRRDVRRR